MESHLGCDKCSFSCTTPYHKMPVFAQGFAEAVSTNESAFTWPGAWDLCQRWTVYVVVWKNYDTVLTKLLNYYIILYYKIKALKKINKIKMAYDINDSQITLSLWVPAITNGIPVSGVHPVFSQWQLCPASLHELHHNKGCCNGLSNELICFISGDSRITQSARRSRHSAATRC